MKRLVKRPLMRTGSRALGLALSSVVLLGCSQQGPLTRRLTTLDTLKTDVARLETEKEQLKREAAESQKENRRIASQLSEVEDENSELASRLDDARSVISRQGLDADKFSPPSRSASETPRRSSPAASKSKGKKPPMAEIRGDRRAVQDREDLPSDDALDAPGPSKKENDPFGHQGRTSDGSPWLPVAKADGKRGSVR